MKIKHKLVRVEVFLTFVICALLIVPNYIYATSSNKIADRTTNKIPLEGDRLLDLYQLYVVEKNGDPYFDVEAAKNNHESQEVIEMGELFNVYSEPAAGTRRFGKISIPIWGNWCGPGYGGGVPIDILDEGCKIYDISYVRWGEKNNRGCNRMLIEYIDKNIHRMTAKEQKMARIIRFYMIEKNKKLGY